MNWPEDFLNKIICGDCLEVMKGMPDNSVDTIITDPPYNLSTIKRFKAKDSGEKWNVKSGVFHRTSKGFMGQEWDNEIAFQIETWEAVYRVAKPGTTLLCFGGTRTYHRLACAIEDAGWIIKDCIMWLYGSGFPKATDISKQLDKGAGKKRIAKKRIRIDNKKTGVAGGSFMSDTVNIDYPDAMTSEATLWNGWKSHGLKPAYEPIIVAMKPNEGSYANNALKWGVAGINIDGGRIPYEEGGTVASNPRLRVERGCKTETGDRIFCQGELGKKNTMVENVKKGGRFPANVILDEEASRLLDEQSGECKTGGRKIKTDCGKSWYKQNVNVTLLQDNGSGASRFFYCAKASKAERNRGCEGLDIKTEMNYGFKNQKCKKCGGYHTEKNIGKKCKCEYPEWVDLMPQNALNKNSHPTVKPLTLLKYLCTLTETPTGGIVLDPFCGSGTTLMACKELKRDYIGIDNNPEYCEIAKRRVKVIPETLF